MGKIPDFTDNEQKLVAQTLSERYGQPITVEVAEAEVQLGSATDDPTECPVLIWQARDACFVIFKLGDSRYRAQFFYTDAEQFGTGRDQFDNLGDCIVTVLQVQSDHERQRAGIKSGMNSFDLARPDDYTGPVVI
jgi:hypothetical protein